jgi:hypothetical protein
MTRKAIMIGSSGPKNSATYLKGVDADLHHFVSFLKAPIGGSWEEEEIAGLYKNPSENLFELFQGTNTDFLLVYFSGHGRQDLNETKIAINDTESISISQLTSIIQSPKALIIIDSCRKFIDEEYSSFSASEYLSFKSLLDQPNSRDRYMQIISESAIGFVIAYACSVGENSGDTELGGFYTYSLLKETVRWYENQNKEGVLSIEDAHDLALEELKFKTNFQQNPQIRTLNAITEKLNLPFAIKTNSL